MKPNRLIRNYGNTLPKPGCVLGIDVGGSKVSAVLCKQDGFARTNILWSYKEDTKKGLKAHIDQIANIINKATDYVIRDKSELIGVCVSSPGRFKEDVIMQGTNPFLAREKSGEFDDVNLVKEYKKALCRKRKGAKAWVSRITNSELQVLVENDAKVMLTGILSQLYLTQSVSIFDVKGNSLKLDYLDGKKIGLFGIGSGVGHSILQVNGFEDMRPITDGHANKLQIRVDDEDWPIVKKAIAYGKKLKKENHAHAAMYEVMVIDKEKHIVRAEDLFRAPTIKAMAGIVHGNRIETQSPNHPQETEQALKIAGKYMARLIRKIKEAKSRDVVPGNGWSKMDKLKASKTNMYIISGGMGSADIGTDIMRYAEDELKNLGIKDIKLFQTLYPQNVSKDWVAPMAAVHALQQHLVQKDMGRE